MLWAEHYLDSTTQQLALSHQPIAYSSFTSFTPQPMIRSFHSLYGKELFP